MSILSKLRLLLSGSSLVRRRPRRTDKPAAKRHATLNPKKAQEIAESVLQIGLQLPVDPFPRRRGLRCHRRSAHRLRPPHCDPDLLAQALKNRMIKVTTMGGFAG
jgi:hypothetical protein